MPLQKGKNEIGIHFSFIFSIKKMLRYSGFNTDQLWWPIFFMLTHFFYSKIFKEVYLLAIIPKANAILHIFVTVHHS